MLTNNLGGRLSAAIRGVAPIHGVSIGARDDKRTWRIDFAPEATAEQKAAAQVALDAFDAAAVPIEDVKAEAQRRIIALTGKSNLQDCMIKQFNALMRAGQLTDKRVSGAALTAEEEAEADTLRAMADRVKAIRAASDALEASTPIPADYAADKHWPG
jgi:hypothetical protein